MKRRSSCTGNEFMEEPKVKVVRALGEKTQWGRIAAVALIGGERYYFMVNRFRNVAMMPADVVDASLPAKPKRTTKAHPYESNGASRDPSCAKCGGESEERVHRAKRTTKGAR